MDVTTQNTNKNARNWGNSVVNAKAEMAMNKSTLKNAVAGNA